MKKLLTFILSIAMVMGVLQAMTSITVSAVETPKYISEIGIARGDSADEAKAKLSGYTIIDKDLNAGAGGKYIYMGYKTTTDPSTAIKGFMFYSNTIDNAKVSYTLDGIDYYQHGHNNTGTISHFPNSAEEWNYRYVDLNDGAGGNYIYLYCTRDGGLDNRITDIVINNSSSYSGYTTAVGYQSGEPVDMNEGAKGQYLYLHYKSFSATIQAKYYYLNSSGNRTSSTYTKDVYTHTQTLTTKPSVPSSVTYNGYSLSFKGYRTDDTAAAQTTTSPSVTYMTSPQTYRAIYTTNVKLTYNANGGEGTPSAQTATQYINAGSSSVVKQNVSFTVPTFTPMHQSKCFLGWSTSSSATSAAYTAGSSVSASGNTTLYAVYGSAHSDSNGDGICDNCSQSMDVPALKNGIYQISNPAELLWFEQYVNIGNTDIDGILLNDIDMTGIAVWKSMETYGGTFDGAGYSIIGLNKNAGVADQKRGGFINVLNGTVKNVVFDSADVFTGSGIGQGVIAYNNAGTISGCLVINSNIQLGNYAGLGFIAGKNLSGGVIENCGAANSTMTRRYSGSSNQTMGGITEINNGTVKNCHTYNCTFNNGTTANGALIASGNAPTNSYYYTADTTVTTYGTSKTAEQFASGEVTYLLNGGVTDGSQVWYQTIIEDDYPVFDGETVYYQDGYYNYIVTLDGNVIGTNDTIILGIDNGDGTYSLPDNVVGYYFDDSFVDAGKYEVFGGEVIDTVNINVSMVNGAQVRYGGRLDENGKISTGNGLRFLATVDRSEFDGESYGMKITAEGSDKETLVDAQKWQDDTTFSVAITDMAATNYNRNFIATPFVKVKYTDGEEKTVYGTQTVTRSIYYVAAGLLKNGGDDEYGVDKYYGLQEVLNAYVNMVGVRLNLYADGTVTASDKYTGDVFFDVASVDNQDGSYTITVTPVTEDFAYPVEILSYWDEFVRINNNNSVVVQNITNSSVENGVLTFTFNLPSGN